MPCLSGFGVVWIMMPDRSQPFSLSALSARRQAMSFRVPDLDANGGFLGDFSSNPRGPWEAFRPSSSMDAPFVPDDGFEELCWEDGQLMSIMYSQNYRPLQKKHSRGAASITPLDKPVSRDHGDASLYVGGIATNYDGTLDPAVRDHHSSRVGSSPSTISDDEMIAWLQNPLDDELQVDDLDPALYSGHHAVSYLPSLSFEKSDGGQCSDSMHRSIGAMVKERPSVGIAKEKQQARVTNTNSATTIFCKESQTQPAIASFGNHNSALTTNSATSGPKPVYRNVEACISIDSSIESTITGRSLQGPNVFMGPNVSHCVIAATSTLHQMQGVLPMKGPGDSSCIDDLTVCNGRVVEDIPSGSKSCFSVDANQKIEKGFGALESTGTSCPDGSANATTSKGGRVDGNGGCVKRKVKDLNDSESQSEDLDLAKQPTLTKRIRAAEVHNKSERKRRERINDKLKALQELIPNANKTDKASMLGEAIEYLKALQSQILVMSYRTGITVPPMLISHGLPHPHVLPHGGIGFATGMGVKTGIMDIGCATSTCWMPRALAPRSLITIPTLSTPATNVTRLPQNALSGPMVGYGTPYFPFATPHAQPFLAHTNQLQKPASMTSHKTPSLHQHTCQPPQLLSTDMCNPSTQQGQQQHVHK